METSLSCAVSFIQPEQIVQVLINGESRDFSATSLRLSELIEELSLAPQRIAIEINRRLVRRAEWNETEVRDGDRVEIVHFVGGGDQTEKAVGRRQKNVTQSFG
jgi:thiamine biosynthesis protein ThiS